MTAEQLKANLVAFSPFTLEVTSDKFNFNNKTVVINEGTPLDYEVKETPLGLIINIENKPMNFFNLIVVFGQNKNDGQIVNYDYEKLKYSLPKRSQFIGFVSDKSS